MRRRSGGFVVSLGDRKRIGTYGLHGERVSRDASNLGLFHVGIALCRPWQPRAMTCEKKGASARTGVPQRNTTVVLVNREPPLFGRLV